MKNNTFFIVAREKDIKIAQARNPDSFYWKKLGEMNRNAKKYTDRVLYNGLEFVDGIEMLDYEEAKAMLLEYRNAMPSHTVLIHAKPLSNRSY
jgi:hypothetical protein